MRFISNFSLVSREENLLIDDAPGKYISMNLVFNAPYKIIIFVVDCV